MTRRAPRLVTAVVLLAAGAVGGLTIQSRAATPQAFVYSTGEIQADNLVSNPDDIDIFLTNTSDRSIEVELHVDNDAATPTFTFHPDTTGVVTLGPNASQVETVEISVPGMLIGRIWFSSSNSTYTAAISYTDNTVKKMITPGQMHMQNSTGALAQTSGIAADELNNLAGKVGRNTKAFCAEGSVRQDAAGTLQMYVTLFSKENQQATITYVTNQGAFDHVVDLVANVRLTDDVNRFLLGAGGPLAGRTDIDTSVRVTATKPLFIACPVYFNRSIGAAGKVAGGTVQDGNHN
jgi:hypothetical protein